MSFKLAKHIRLYSIIDYTWKLYQSSYILLHWDSSAEPGTNLLSWMYQNQWEQLNQKRKLLAPGCPPCRVCGLGGVLCSQLLHSVSVPQEVKIRGKPHDDKQGLIIAIMQVLAFSPIKESCVSLLAGKVSSFTTQSSNTFLQSQQRLVNFCTFHPSWFVCLQSLCLLLARFPLREGFKKKKNREYNE